MSLPRSNRRGFLAGAGALAAGALMGRGIDGPINLDLGNITQDGPADGGLCRSLIAQRGGFFEKKGGSESPCIKITIDTTVGFDGYESLTKSVHVATLADGSSSITLDWGDGTVETHTSDINDAVHTYASDGIYTVKLSDDVADFGWGSPGGVSTARKNRSGVIGFESTAKKLLTLCFGFDSSVRDSSISSFKVENVSSLGSYGLSGIYTNGIEINGLTDIDITYGTADFFGGILAPYIVIPATFTKVARPTFFRNCLAEEIVFKAKLTQFSTDRTWGDNASIKRVKFPAMTREEVRGFNVTYGMNTATVVYCSDGQIAYVDGAWTDI